MKTLAQFKYSAGKHEIFASCVNYKPCSIFTAYHREKVLNPLTKHNVFKPSNIFGPKKRYLILLYDLILLPILYKT